MVAGSITICDDPNVAASVRLDSTIGFVKGGTPISTISSATILIFLNNPDSKTYVPPRFHLEGAVLGKPLRIELTNFQRIFYDWPMYINVTNLSTGDRVTVQLNQTSIYGIYEGYFPTVCTEDAASVPVTDPPTFAAAPFDVIEASLWQNETWWSNFSKSRSFSTRFCPANSPFYNSHHVLRRHLPGEDWSGPSH